MTKYTLLGSESFCVDYIIKDNDINKLKEEALLRLSVGQTARIFDNETMEKIDLETI
jgi:hypothetical protein